MTPTEQAKKHLITHYVDPARQRGEAIIQIRVGNVQKELGWINRIPSVFSTLSSKKFQREAGLELIEKKGGPSSGGPSTTVQFIYRITKALDSSSAEEALPDGEGLMSLWGILADAYKELGGGDAYLKGEREAWGADPWEKLGLNRQTAKTKEVQE